MDIRNEDNAVDKLVGITIDKAFIDSVANTIGTDLSKYKIIEAEQFACSLIQVSRDGKMPIAMYAGGEKAILSPAYSMFEVIDKSELLPSYLMMWFRRSEFDREASFYAVGGVRGSLLWDDFLDFRLPIPDIEEQQEIVAQYEAITRRIALNERICANLEETAQALYNKMFVQDIDPDNLPDGWRMGTIEEFCKEVRSGGTPNRSNNRYWNCAEVPWLKSGEVQNKIIISAEEYISNEGLANSSAKLIPADSVIMAMYGGGTVGNVGYLAFETSTNQACCNMICHTKEQSAYLYFYLLVNQDKISRLANGGAQENLNQNLITSQPIIIGAENKLFALFVRYMTALGKVNMKLRAIQSVLINTLER
ncbi:restriction endonuclease subunit S [Porphyromonas sp.]|uniref:restriction endonuclease subunit S n=1 Tax=Porphyromonas sp. TaxID=1924944 RepID=UPI003994B76D